MFELEVVKVNSERSTFVNRWAQKMVKEEITEKSFAQSYTEIKKLCDQRKSYVDKISKEGKKDNIFAQNQAEDPISNKNSVKIIDLTGICVLANKFDQLIKSKPKEFQQDPQEEVLKKMVQTKQAIVKTSQANFNSIKNEKIAKNIWVEKYIKNKFQLKTEKCLEWKENYNAKSGKFTCVPAKKTQSVCSEMKLEKGDLKCTKYQNIKQTEACSTFGIDKKTNKVVCKKHITAWDSAICMDYNRITTQDGLIHGCKKRTFLSPTFYCYKYDYFLGNTYCIQKKVSYRDYRGESKTCSSSKKITQNGKMSKVCQAYEGISSADLLKEISKLMESIDGRGRILKSIRIGQHLHKFNASDSNILRNCL